MKLGMIRNAADREAFEYLKKKDLSFMEICLNFDNEAEKFNARADEIAALSKEFGIPLASIGRWNGIPLDEEGKIRPAMLQEVKDTLASIAKIGCPIYVCGCNYVEKLSLYQNYTAAINFFRTVIELAKPYGIQVAVYNCNWSNWVVGIPQWEIILGELPELKIKFDASHSIASDRDYKEELRVWGKRIAHVHVKGYIKHNGEYVDAAPAGLDGINWNEEMGFLYAAGYEGGLSIEPHSAVWQGELGERGIDYTIGFMKKYLV